MPKLQEYDVLICGAGASGLALSIELARRGISFRLIEKLKDPFIGSRGKGLQARTLEIFEDMGVVDRVMAAGGPYPAQREYKEGGTFVDVSGFESLPSTIDEPYREPVMLPQFKTEAILRERLLELGAQPEFGSELVAFTQDRDFVQAEVRHASGTESITARFLVAADGGRSFVRKSLDIPFPGKTLNLRALVADVQLEGLNRDLWHRFQEGGMENQLALCPLAGTELFQLQAPVPMEGDIDHSLNGLNQLILERTGRRDIQVSDVVWVSSFQMNARLAERYRAGRIFLVGDAAHVHPPTGGQGLNTSVQDAYNLAWKLAAVLRGAPENLLDTYEQERRGIAMQVLGLSTNLLDAAKQGHMRRGREVTQLDLCYPDSVLSLKGDDRKGLNPGNRAPDAHLLGAAGRSIRLFNLFRGTHWTLLGFGVSRAQGISARSGLHIHIIGPKGEYRDDGANFQIAYGLKDGEWVLIRPDGYIAAIIPSERKEALEAYLRDVGL